MSRILVSVIVPTYNRGAIIAVTLESALSQNIPSDCFELIVVDDGSTDETPEYLQAFCRKYPQTRLITQKNCGVAEARNRGLQEARGQYIAYLDHDDIWLPHKLSMQLDVLQKDSKVAVAYCRWLNVDENNVLLPKKEQVDWCSQNTASGYVYDNFVRTNFVVSMSVPLIRTSYIKEVGGFNPAMVPCDDWDLWLRLSKRWQFVFVPEILVHYRTHGFQQSHNRKLMAKGAARVLAKQWPHLMLKPKLLLLSLTAHSFYDSLETHAYAKQLLFAGKYRQCVKTFLVSCLRRPMLLMSPQWIYLLRRVMNKNSKPY
jgi:glycosyltransferase involved in cell wall biosynthesis